MNATRLRVRVAPGARRSSIVGRHGDAWKLSVSAPPEAGRANDAVVKLLAETLQVSRDAVTVLSGHGARDKVVSLGGIEAPDVERRLQAAVER